MEHIQGIYWEKGALQGCSITFHDEKSVISIGSEAADGPELLINSSSYIYLYIHRGPNDCPHDYYVIEDFDGPFRLRRSGHVYDFGDQRIRLL